MRKQDNVGLSLFHELTFLQDQTQINIKLHKLSLLRLRETSASRRKSQFTIVKTLDDVLYSSEYEISVYVINKLYIKPITDLVIDVCNKFKLFISQQYCIPGRNSIVRLGGVCTLILPNGKKVICKQTNQQKINRFIKEQENYNKIIKRLHPDSLRMISNTSDSLKFWIEIKSPLAVIWDGYSKTHFSFMEIYEGVSLEDILMTEFSNEIRKMHLRNYRLIFDYLCDFGIVWKDMCPRNIIVLSKPEGLVYQLYDFEKTEIFDGILSKEYRSEICRGQICIEELCVICRLDEVLECFDGYFCPEEWDVNSKKPLPFPMRPDMENILQHRNVSKITLGEYNRIDKEILSVRSPIERKIISKRLYPGHIGFKVEHYLSMVGYADAGEYDRKITEVLISANKNKCFALCVKFLNKILDNLEVVLLVKEFQYVYSGGLSLSKIASIDEIKVLRNIIDELYSKRYLAESFVCLCQGTK
ncbi:MAG: hypothetical protein JNL74_20110 [Fibrobacteres bacterium]|nr:hypothetical protein [Fibrobacterota bacterium]